MSTAHNFRPTTPTGDTSKYPHALRVKGLLWKSIVLWVGGTVGVLVVLIIVAGFVALHTPASSEANLADDCRTFLLNGDISELTLSAV